MEKIIHFSEVLQYLKDQEIVCTYSHGKATSYYNDNHGIMVKAPNSRYHLTYKEFSELFGKETFYLYKPEESGIDQEKDDAYYSWKSKNAN